MKRSRLMAAAMVLGIVAILGLLAWNIPATARPTAAVQVSREAGGTAGIAVSVIRADEGLLDQPGIGQDLSAMKGKVLPFAISLDTHAGTIADLDLNGKVFIRDASGMEIPGIVKQLSVSSHHTSYVAAFPKLDSRGNPLTDPAQQHLTMVVKEIGTLKVRELQWDLTGSATVENAPQGMNRLLVGAMAMAAVLGGFLALLSPCMLHTTSYWAALVASSSTKEEVENSTLPALRAGVVRTVLLFIAGFTLMYVVLGTLAGAVGSISSHALSSRLGPYKLVMDVIAGIFMIVFGLQTTGLLNAGWVHRLQIPLPKFMTRGLGTTEKPAAFAMGLSMAVGCVSCIGGTVFLGLLAYLGTTTWVTGLEVSLLYSLGLATPLLLLTFGVGNWLTGLRDKPMLRQAIAIFSGGTLVAVGLLVLIGQGDLVESGLFWMMAKAGGAHLLGGHIH